MPSFRAAIAALVVIVTALAPPPSAAFTGGVHQHIAEQAGRLMPASLRGILGQNLEELRAGAGATLQADEDGLFLYADGSYGTLDQTVLRQTQRVLDLLSHRAPMATVAREMGVLSHLVALASDPLHVTAHDVRTRDWADDYERYVEQQRPRFAVAFFGYGSSELDRDDVPGFVRAAGARTRANAPLLREMFLLPDGTVARTAGFDEKHPVFGIASLGYSRAISDTARLWLYAWIKAGGDSAGVPFPQAMSASTVGSAP